MKTIINYIDEAKHSFRIKSHLKKEEIPEEGKTCYDPYNDSYWEIVDFIKLKDNENLDDELNAFLKQDKSFDIDDFGGLNYIQDNYDYLVLCIDKTNRYKGSILLWGGQDGLKYKK